MDRSKIAARFSLLPRSHKVASLCIAAAVALGGFAISFTAPSAEPGRASVSTGNSEAQSPVQSGFAGSPTTYRESSEPVADPLRQDASLNAPPRQGSEEQLLRETLALLDTQSKVLTKELLAARQNPRPHDPAPTQADSLAGREGSASKSSSQTEVEKKISNLRRQQMLVQARLKETQREARTTRDATPSAQAKGVSPPTAQVESKPSAEEPTPVKEHQALVPEAPNTTVPTAIGWRSGAWEFGLMLALPCGALSLALSLWRFRPVPSSQVLQKLLPEGVIFVGGVTEGRK